MYDNLKIHFYITHIIVDKIRNLVACILQMNAPLTWMKGSLQNMYPSQLLGNISFMYRDLRLTLMQKQMGNINLEAQNGIILFDGS